MTKLVTRESLTNMIKNAPHDKLQHIVGRALVVLFNNQTADEQSSNNTAHDNSMGFAGPDARTGCLGAKYYMKHKSLQPWQVEQWTRDYRGAPRIAKYHKQLNEAAIARQATR